MISTSKLLHVNTLKFVHGVIHCFRNFQKVIYEIFQKLKLSGSTNGTAELSITFPKVVCGVFTPAKRNLSKKIVNEAQEIDTFRQI